MKSFGRCLAYALGAAVIASATPAPNGAAAQPAETLPADVQFDILRLELSAAARAGRHKEVLVTADKMRKTGIDLPIETSFLEARAFHALGAESMARQALVKYLKAVGRTGENYHEAIKLFVEIKRVQREKAERAQKRADVKKELAAARAAHAAAQARIEDWKKLAVVFGGPGDDTATALAHGGDGTVIVAGDLHVRKAGEGKSVDATLPWITAFDAEGRRIWHRPLGSAVDAGTLRSVARIGANGFAFGGAQKGYQFVAVSDRLGNIIDNADGDPWVLGFAPALDGEAGAIARLLPGGDIVAIGAVEIGSEGKSGPPPARLPVAVRLDPAGKIKAKAVLGDVKTPARHRIGDAVVVDGSDIVLAGSTRTGTDANALPEAYLMRIDSAGKTVWNRRFAATGTGGMALHALTVLPEGGLVAVGHDGPDQLVLRLTEAGDVLWRKKVKAPAAGPGRAAALCAHDAARALLAGGDKGTGLPPDFEAVRAFACAPARGRARADAVAPRRGGFVVVGYEMNGNDEAVGRIVLTALTRDGALVWRTVLGDGATSRARAAVATADGGVIVAGTAAGWKRDVALFKVDGSGALTRFTALAPEPPARTIDLPAHEPAPPAPGGRAAPVESPPVKAEPAGKPAPAAAPGGGAEYDLFDLIEGLFGGPAEPHPAPRR